MTSNPYKSPPSVPDSPGEGLSTKRRRPIGYIASLIVGVLLFTPFLMPALADVDDAGTLQMILGGFLGLVLYHFIIYDATRFRLWR